MQLACSTLSFPEERLDMALARVAWAGYTAAEVALAVEPYPEEEWLRGRLRAEELELAAVFAGELPRGAGEAALPALARIGRAAAQARALDAAVVVLTAPAEGEPAEVAAALGLLDRALGDLPIDVCVVNGTGTVLASVEDLRRFWEAGLPGRGHLALDPAQAALAGWDPADLDVLPELPRHVYLTDARNGRPVPPGEGDVELPALADALRLRGYAGAVCLRLENADPWAVEPVARETRVLAGGWFGA